VKEVPREPDGYGDDQNSQFWDLRITGASQNRAGHIDRYLSRTA
jgi:hypothetical protein